MAMSLIKTKDYQEEYARYSLHYACDRDITDLFHLDSPDLQDPVHSVGIEVVNDVYRDEEERERFVEKYWGKPIFELKEREIRLFEQNGAQMKIENGIISSARMSGGKPNHSEHLINTIKGKVDKLNDGHYTVFKRYELYVFVRSTFLDENFDYRVWQTIEAIRMYQRPVSFSTLYLDYWYGICICNMETETFIRKPVTKEMRAVIAEEVEKLWTTL